VGRHDSDREDELAATPKFLRDEWESFVNPQQMSNDDNLESDLDAAEASIESRTVAGQLQQAFDEELRRDKEERRAKERKALGSAVFTGPFTYKDLIRLQALGYSMQLQQLFKWKVHEEERERWRLSPRVWKRLRADYDCMCEEEDE